MPTRPAPKPLPNKDPATWPCHCCTCQSIPGDTFDPKCHTHSDGHGRRGCVKHNVTPVACNCGCITDPKAESARHAEMAARGERFKTQLEYSQRVVPIRTDDTAEELAELHEAKRAAAIAQHEAGKAEFQAHVAAAVELALSNREA